MWVVAGVLLGLVLVASLVGFHTGPHAHALAGAVGLLAAVWLVVMAVGGRSTPDLWALLSADLVASAGLSMMAWKGLAGRGGTGSGLRFPEAAEGVAVSDLVPEGIVRVRGEQWSAVSVNGAVRAGTRVQVLRAGGVRLDVWGEDPEVVPPSWTASIDGGESKERYT